MVHGECSSNMIECWDKRKSVRRRILRRFLIWLALLVAFRVTVLSAQETGVIEGTVTDSSGAVVVGAKITVTDNAGVAHTAISDGQGNYAVRSLPPASFAVSVSAKDFAPFHTESLALSAGQTLTMDVTLRLAKESTVVIVEGQKAAEVETETAQVSGTITQKELVTLGLNGRNFTQLISLTPGVSNQTGQDEAKVGVVGSAKYSVNGGRVEYNTFSLDGSDILNTGINASRGQAPLIVYPSLDALSEVKVLTSNYGAMYGRTASGTVLATTKLGTTSFHGDLYEFVRNEIFNARNYFDQTASAPLYRRNDFGGTLGGPFFIPGIYDRKRSKTFFFVSEEFRLEKSPVSFNQAVPSVAERNGIFNDVCPTSGPIAASGGFLFKRSAHPDCPATFQPNTLSGQAVGYPGNILPVSWFGQAMLGTGIIPLPNSNRGCNSSISSCYVTDISPNTFWHEDLFRIDQEIGSKIKLTGRYVHDDWNTTVLTPQWGFVQNSFPTVQNSFDGPGINVLVGVTQTLSSTLLNQTSFSYTSEHITLQDKPGPGATLTRPSALDAPCTTPDSVTGYTQCPMGVLFNNGFGGKLPGIVIGGTNAAYGGNGFSVDSSYMPWSYANPTYSVRDDVSKAIGKHTLQFGVQLAISQQNEVNAATGANTGDIQGILTYSNINSFYSTGNAFADFLIGPTNSQGHVNDHSGIQSFQQDSAQFKYYNRYKVAEPYIQDDWKVSPRFTLNVGLRVSLFGLWHEKYNNVYNWNSQAFSPATASRVTVDPSVGNLVDSATLENIPLNLNNLDPRITNGLVRCGVNGVSAGCMRGHPFNPAPRIGFAWDPFGTGTTSVRAGYGIFFHHGTSAEANTGSLMGSAPLVLDMTQSRPYSIECIGGGRGAANCAGQGAYPLNVTAIPTKAVWPYVQQWSLSIERQLSKNIVATAAYVGSKGTHLTVEQQINQLVPLASSQNPFGARDPITFDTCNSYSGGTFLVGDSTITSAQPAFINLLAACFGAANSKIWPDPNSLRQFAPGLGQIYSLQNIADSSYNAFQATLRRATGPIFLNISYTYSHSIDDSSDRNDANFINAYDLRANRASSNFDMRNMLNVGYIWQDPFVSLGRWMARLFVPNPNSCPSCTEISYSRPYEERMGFGPNAAGYPDDDTQSPRASKSRSFIPHPSGTKILQALFSDWEFSGITIFQSGTPFSIINGGGSNGISVLDNAGVANGLGPASYPDLVGNPIGPTPLGANNSKSFGPALGNAAAFAAPQGLTFGAAGRNSMNNPSRTNFDMSLLKSVRIWNERNLQFRVEAFNVFNHTQFRIYDPLLGNTGSNTISCYGGASVDYSAAGGGGVNCLTGSSFLHPVDAHRSRTLQLGAKFIF